jgi:hypothetical protein
MSITPVVSSARISKRNSLHRDEAGYKVVNNLGSRANSVAHSGRFSISDM